MLFRSVRADANRFFEAASEVIRAHRRDACQFVQRQIASDMGFHIVDDMRDAARGDLAEGSADVPIRVRGETAHQGFRKDESPAVEDQAMPPCLLFVPKEAARRLSIYPRD